MLRRGFTVVLFILLLAQPVLAHDAPEGSEWVMADWMFLTFVMTAIVGLVVLIVAYKRGWLSDLEGEAKLYMMKIDEPDYYTPDADKAKVEHGS